MHKWRLQMPCCIVAVVGGVRECKSEGKAELWNHRFRDDAHNLQTPVCEIRNGIAPRPSARNSTWPSSQKGQFHVNQSTDIFPSKIVSVWTTAIDLAHPTQHGSGPMLSIQSVHTTACVRGGNKIRHESHRLAASRWRRVVSWCCVLSSFLPTTEVASDENVILPFNIIVSFVCWFVFGPSACNRLTTATKLEFTGFLILFCLYSFPTGKPMSITRLLNPSKLDIVI